MPAYTRTLVRTTDFTAADGANPETAFPWLDSFPNTAGGYYVIRGNRLQLDFGQPGDQGLADLTGTYNNRQYVIARLLSLTTAPSAARWLGGYLHGQGANATADLYQLRISQDSSSTPLTTKFFRIDNAGTPVEVASTTAITWADNDLFFFIAYDGVLELYRDSGGGFGTTPLLTYTDPSPLTGGVPGIHINGQDSLELDDVEMGTAVIAAANPVLSGQVVVSTGNGIATVRVTTDTAPSGSSTLAVQVLPAADPTPTAAAILASPTLTITSGASGARDFNLTVLTNGTAYRAHFAQTGPSNVVSTVSFTPSTVPGAPTIGTAVAGNAQATVNGTAPATNGGAAITGYRSTATPGGSQVTGASLPITHTGLTNGTAYTFTLEAENLRGYGAPSAASNSVTPSAGSPPPPPPPPPPGAGFDFHTAAGCIFGAISGSLVGLAREVGVSILPLVYSRTAPYGLVAALAATPTDSNGRLPRLTSASLAAGTSYRIVFVWPDGSEYAISMAATA